MKKILCLFLLLLSCSPPFSIEERSFDLAPPRDEVLAPLRIFAMDVGQGDATLVIGPSGRSLLIDGGPPEGGNKAVKKQIEQEGLRELGWVIATHFDIDHIGGLPSILEEYPPLDGVLDRGEATAQDHPLYEDYLEVTQMIRRTAEAGDWLDLGHGAIVKIVVVNGEYLDGRRIHLNPDEENEASIGLLIQYGDFTYFTAGDLTGGGSPGGFETKDLETWVGEIIRDIDILHIGHHGSATSTNENLLEETSPEFAIISVGRENNYHHPSPLVLQRLVPRGIKIYRTDQDGSIQVESDGITYEVTTFQ